MSTAMIDCRSNNLRSNVLETPYWITSGELTFGAASLAAVLFSFPIAAGVSPGYGTTTIIVQEVCLEVVTGFTSDSTTLTIGTASIVSDDITTTGAVTTIDLATYWDNTDGDADILAAGRHFPTNSSDWVAARILGVGGADYVIVPVDSTVICVTAWLAGGTLIAGSAYFHMQICVVPAVAAA